MAVAQPSKKQSLVGVLPLDPRFRC